MTDAYFLEQKTGRQDRKLRNYNRLEAHEKYLGIGI